MQYAGDFFPHILHESKKEVSKELSKLRAFTKSRNKCERGRIIAPVSHKSAYIPQA